MATVRRIEPLSLARTVALIYGGIGLLVGALVSFAAAIGSAFAAVAEHSPIPFAGLIFGVGAIVLFPLLYAFFAFLGGLIVASLYNLAARWTGGVVLDLG
jgi:hypothetical protein